MRRHHAAALLLLFSLSCRSRPDAKRTPAKADSDPAPPPVAAAASAPEPTPEPVPTSAALPEGKPLTGRISRCGWGQVSPAPAPDAPPWLIALVDVAATRELPGLRVLLTELYVGEEPIARGSGDASLLVQEAGSAYSFSAAGTRDLGGTLPEGTSRLRVATRIDGTMKALKPKAPSRCRVVLTSDDGDNVGVEGPLDPPWEMQ